MSKIFLTTSLIVSILLGGIYWYQSEIQQCPVPLPYRVGSIDPSFNISVEDAKDYLTIAENIWEEGADRNLFNYDEEADFAINFIFDERQEMANSEASQRGSLDEQKAESDAVQANIDSLQADYEELSAIHEDNVEAYETRLGEYNERVQRYNDQGGAPENVFEELEAERRALERDAEELNQTTDELNDLVNEINRLVERGQILVDRYNRQVQQYNAEFGFAREFTQGDYQGDSINIYKFSSDAELIRVLAHEFGHALGIDHVEASSSLMYYLLIETDEVPELSEEDLLAFADSCGISQTWAQSLRQNISNWF
jgi:prefoldin subunit 5